MKITRITRIGTAVTAAAIGASVMAVAPAQAAPRGFTDVCGVWSGLAVSAQQQAERGRWGDRDDRRDGRDRNDRGDRDRQGNWNRNGQINIDLDRHGYWVRRPARWEVTVDWFNTWTGRSGRLYDNKVLTSRGAEASFWNVRTGRGEIRIRVRTTAYVGYPMRETCSGSFRVR